MWVWVWIGKEKRDGVSEGGKTDHELERNKKKVLLSNNQFNLIYTIVVVVTRPDAAKRNRENTSNISGLVF